LRTQARLTHSRVLERFSQELLAHRNAPFDKIKASIQKLIFKLMAEQKDEDNHKQWCDAEIAKTQASKADKEEHVEELNTKMDALKAHVTELQSEIQAADQFVANLAAHMKEATEIREIGKSENKEAIKDASDAQAAISKAIAVLEAHYKESGQIDKEAWEFSQVKAEEPVVVKDKPSTWGASYTGTADPNNQPGGIVTVLKTTMEDFAKMESETQAQEATDETTYQSMMRDCGVEKAARTRESEVKSQEKKRAADKLATLTTAEKQTSDELDAVNQYYKDLEPACMDGDSSYADRKAARKKEIDALHEAQGIFRDAFKEKEAASLAQHGARAGRRQGAFLGM